MENLDKSSMQTHSDSKTNEFFNTGAAIMGVPVDVGIKISKVILRDVIQRITPEEAKHFITQLPSALKVECQDRIQMEPNKSIDAEMIKKHITHAAGSEQVDPEDVARHFWEYLTSWLNNDPNEHKGITAKILSQLPEDIERLLGRVVEEQSKKAS